jgi:hypothetical protein
MKKILFATLAVFCFSAFMYGQPKPVEKTPNQSHKSTEPNDSSSFKARYDHGIFGSTGKQNGYFKFDDANARVVFYREDGREMFSFPYASLILIYPETQEHMSQTANVITRIPFPGTAMAGLKGTESKYLVIDYDDPDVDAKGTATFKFNNKEWLLTFIDSLGSRSKLKQRGQAWYRPRNSTF